MEAEYKILIILFIHWVADFVFQTYNMGTRKSVNNYWLVTHTFMYTLIWFLAGMFFYDFFSTLLPFLVITFICHTIQDYFTSRWTSKLYKRQKFYGFPAFWTVIGFDQLLHYIQLVLTYKFLEQ